MKRAAILALLVGCGARHGSPDGGDLDLALADGAAGDLAAADGGVTPQRACGTTFRFHGGLPASVSVAGEFNDFDPTKNPLTGPDRDGNWSTTLTLAPGAYAYKLVLTNGNDTTWQLDPANPYTKFVGGVENSVVEVDDCKTPLLAFVALDKTAAGTLHAEVQYLDGSGGAGLDPRSVAVLLDGRAAGGAKLDGSGRITVDTSGLAKTKHRLVVKAADTAGRAAVDLHVPFWIEDQPFDFRDGLMYFTFTDRFKNGDPSNDSPSPNVDARANYEGGDFAGITAALDAGYFDALGARTLWISPPNANPDGGFAGSGGYLYSGYHGYWPIKGRDTQKRFGDLATLKTLVAHAHARGMRVIVDAVLNHVHAEHPYWTAHGSDGWFNPLMANGQTCVCSDAAGCGNWGTARETCWFQPYLPDLDYTKWDALVAMVDDALFWAREVDVDGFRVDAVKHFKLAATKRLRSKLHDQFEWTGPLFYLVGETFDGDRGLIESFIGPNALSAQFDFPIYFSIINTFASYSSSLRELEGATAQSDAVFGAAPMSPFVGNHDTARFLSLAQGDGHNDPWNAPPPTPTVEDPWHKLRLALAFVATSPGVPMIYYGDEYGQPGAGDPDNRRFMKWSGYSSFEQSTIDLVKKLGAARKELVALARGDRRTLWIDDDHYVYSRAAGGSVAVVVINRDFNNGGGGAPWVQAVPVPPWLPLPDGTVLRDRLGGPSVTVAGGKIPLSQPIHSSAVLAP